LEADSQEIPSVYVIKMFMNVFTGAHGESPNYKSKVHSHKKSRKKNKAEIMLSLLPFCFLSKNMNYNLPVVSYGYKKFGFSHSRNNTYCKCWVKCFHLIKEITGWWRKLYNEELLNLYYLHFIRMVKFRWMRYEIAIGPFWSHTCDSIHTWCFPMVCFARLALGCRYEQIISSQVHRVMIRLVG
jgi:hypothetical protein